MNDYTALLDDSFDDYVIVSGKCKEKQNNKDIEGTNLISKLYVLT